jgi:hypothetical protein
MVPLHSFTRGRRTGFVFCQFVGDDSLYARFQVGFRPDPAGFLTVECGKLLGVHHAGIEDDLPIRRDGAAHPAVRVECGLLDAEEPIAVADPVARISQA